MGVIVIRPGSLDPFSLVLTKRDSLSTLRSKIAKKLSLDCDLFFEYYWEGVPFAIDDGAWIVVGPLCPLRLAEHDSQTKT
jgi:hypothetical protein